MRTITRLATRLSLVAAAAFSAPGVGAQEAPDPRTVHIRGFQYNGSGCPQSSVAWNLSPDARALTLLFDRFLVDAAQNGGRQTKKNCTVALDLAVPPGWAYTLFSVDYRGFVALDRDGEARLRSWYSLDGSEQIRISNMKLDGPIERDFEQRAWVPLDTLPWLSCQRPTSRVIISTELMAEGRRAMLAVDSIDGHLTQRYGIAWRRCSNASMWGGTCQAVLETHWGTDMNRFHGQGAGASHQDAKGAARQQALQQCEAARQSLRPLVRATTRCIVDEPYCVAQPR